MKKIKIIFKFIQAAFWSIATLVTIVFTFEYDYSQLITPNTSGLFCLNNLKFITIGTLQHVFQSNFNVYALILLVIPILCAIFGVIILLLMLIRKRIFPIIDILLIVVDGVIFYISLAIFYYVAIYKDNLQLIWNTMILTGFSQDNLEVAFKAAMIWLTAILAVVALVRFLILGFRSIGEANTKKATKVDKNLDVYRQYVDLNKDKIIRNLILNKPKDVDISFVPLGSQNKFEATTNLNTFTKENGTLTQFVNTNKAFSNRILKTYNEKGKVILLENKEKK